VIAAPQGPTRVAPDNPGGMVVPDQDKLVYERLTGDGDDGTEQLMAPPEEPTALPPARDGVTPTGPLTGPAPTVTAEAPPEEELEPPSITITPAPAPDIVATAPPQPEATAPTPTPAAPAAGTSIAEIEPDIAAAQAAEVSATAGVAVVQIGAYETDALAAGAWQDVKSRNTDLLSGLKPDIKMVTVNGKTWYRLRVGPFTTRDAATDLCAALKTRGRDCLVAKP
jgi:cell division protein FtsN